jgi:hypothetical protein
MLKYYKKLPNPLGFVANRIEKWENHIITGYIASVLENFQKEPQLVAAMLKKPLELVIDDFLAHPPKGLSGFTSGAGIQSSGNALVDIGQAVLPMFGAKGKKLAQGLAFLPLLANKGQSNTTGKNPFDH